MEELRLRLLTNHIDFSGSICDFYKVTIERNSIDTRCMRLNSTVHYGQVRTHLEWYPDDICDSHG